MRRHGFVYIIVFVFTILDVAFTAKGFELGVITEANPIIAYFLELSAGLTFLGILIYVGAALLLIYRLSPEIRWLNVIMAGLAGIKLYTLVLHIQWFSEYFVIDF